MTRERLMIRRAAVAGMAVAILMATVLVFAHEITFKGTAISADKESVQMNAVDPETKKVTPMKFVVDDLTKVLRDDVLIKFADAKIQKGEAISVTVDHDLDEELAQVIRLGASK